MENKKFYRHKKSGKLYSLVSDNFCVKDIVKAQTSFDDDSPEPRHETVYEWRHNLILYKAEYDCPNGPFFARLPKDFYDSFEEVIIDADGTILVANADHRKQRGRTAPNMKYQDCYYFSEHSGCLKDLIDYGWPDECVHCDECPRICDNPKDDFIRRMDCIDR